MYNKDIRYTLERYRIGGSNRYVCPQCGRMKCFTRYVDVETGEYLSEDCGMCDHKASCGYHYPPKDFFRDHPELDCRNSRNTDYINGQPVLRLTNQRPYSPIQRLHPVEKKHQTQFFDLSWAEKSMQRTSTFRQWLELLPVDKERVKQVAEDYYLGGTSKDVVINGINHGKAVIFWLIDEMNRVHDAKLMAYTADGHRVAGWGNWMRSICQKSHNGPQLQETEKVLFGLHLLPRYPDKTVCIVESEKTAVVCASYYPQCLWLATGGCGNLQREKLQPLRGRKLVVYPDSGEYAHWKECMEKSGHTAWHVVDFMEQYEANTDIADILTDGGMLSTESLLPPPPDGCPF